MVTTPPPTPAGWFPDPAGTNQQRYFDGQKWTDQYAPFTAPPGAAAPRKKSSVGKIVLGVVAAIMLLVIVTSIASGGDDTASTASSSATSTSAGQDNAAAGARIGTPVSDGKFEFVVSTIDRSPTAGDPTNEFLQETAQGEYVNVRLTVKNTGNEAQTYFSSNQKLIVGGKKFDAAQILGLPGDNSNINPGLSIDTVVSFDVPPGTAPDAVELHDSAFSGGATVDL